MACVGDFHDIELEQAIVILNDTNATNALYHMDKRISNETDQHAAMSARLENFHKNKDFRFGQIDYMTWWDALGYLLDNGRPRQGCMVSQSQFDFVLLHLTECLEQHWFSLGGAPLTVYFLS
jgi:hypothetical protein